MLRSHFLFSLVLLAVAVPLSAAPVRLRCNAMDQPLGIGTAAPRLSWQSDSGAKDWKQAGYQVLIATRPELVVAGKTDVWDSGRVASDASVDIPYGGPALLSRTRYFWSVQVWDNQGKSGMAAHPAWWETGLLKTSDWTAQWITRKDDLDEDTAGIRWIWTPGGDALKTTPGTVAEFRYKLDLDGRPMRAIFSAAAHGNYVVSVNGEVTGSKTTWTAFDVEDIAGKLHGGSNEISIKVTVPMPGPPRPGAPEPPKTVPAGLAALLRITDAHGMSRKIVSDATWQAKGDQSTGWQTAEVFANLNDTRLGALPGVPPHPAGLLRQDFALHGAIRQARLYVTAAGSYRMSLNGQRVGVTSLTPDFTDYRKRIEYQTYDVASLLHAGGNTIGAVLGDGWYGSPLLWNGSHSFAAPVRLMAQLEVLYADGTRESVGTTPEWKTSSSPILSSQIYAGEIYDARLEQRGWDTSGFKAAGWEAALSAAAPAAAITAQIGSAVHQTQTIAPKAVNVLPNGEAVYDMGQNMVGWTALHVTGQPGTTVKMRFAERLNPDGSIYTENLRNADAADTYILRGGGPEVYTPHFTFHGFRYVQVSGLPGKAGLGALSGEVMNSLAPEPTGRLKTSSALLNRMWDLGIWGQRGNFLSIPTDCPQRDERLGWMGDAGVFWQTGSYNFDIEAFTGKFMDDIVDAQGPAGSFSNISPDILGGMMGPSVGAPGWGDAGVIVPYTTWLQYGDKALVEQHWQAMESYMDFIQKANPNFLRQKQVGANFGDWLAPDQGTPKDLVGTAYWALVAKMMGEMARATGHDGGKYDKLFGEVRDAYQKAYLGTDGAVAGETQTGYLLSLYVGLAPEAARAAITRKLVANIGTHDEHLTTGFLGTPFLLFALSENGQTDLAYKLLLQETFPSWGYMISKGATTWWERWNGDSGDPAMNSYNHYSFGSVVDWVYRDTVGIDADRKDPGFHHIVLHPHFTSSLQFADGEYDSVYGTIRSSWKRMPSGLVNLKVSIPANTSATVYLGDSPDGKEVGSGTYEFTVPAMR